MCCDWQWLRWDCECEWLAWLLWWLSWLAERLPAVRRPHHVPCSDSLAPPPPLPPPPPPPADLGSLSRGEGLRPVPALGLEPLLRLPERENGERGKSELGFRAYTDNLCPLKDPPLVRYVERWCQLYCKHNLRTLKMVMSLFTQRCKHNGSVQALRVKGLSRHFNKYKSVLNHVKYSKHQHQFYKASIV